MRFALDLRACVSRTNGGYYCSTRLQMAPSTLHCTGLKGVLGVLQIYTTRYKNIINRRNPELHMDYRKELHITKVLVTYVLRFITSSIMWVGSQNTRTKTLRTASCNCMSACLHQSKSKRRICFYFKRYWDLKIDLRSVKYKSLVRFQYWKVFFCAMCYRWGSLWTVWASYQTGKIAGGVCIGNIFPAD